MKAKRIRIFFFIFTVVTYINAECQDFVVDEKIIVDSIVITKNWRTKASIIFEELGFKAKDTIRQSVLDTMTIRLWNVGNFAKISYELDSLPNGHYTVHVIARDAFTVVPILSFSGNRKDWNLSLGVSDNNFLGRNIRMNLGGTLGTNRNSFRLGVNIPRQLLYKNMSLSANLEYGHGKNYRYEHREKSSVIAYSIEQISGGISNPWHQDFKYTFSPNFGWSIFRHTTDTSLVTGEIPFSANYTIQYVTLSIGESIGYIYRKRHQKNGFQMGLGVGIGIGLDHNSPFYYSVNYGFQYHKLFTSMVQLSAEFSTGYTSTAIPSLLYYKGANDVKGILTGEIAGQSFYTSYIGCHLTYINRDWFALEQSFFVNWGNGADQYFDLYNENPLYGIGTGFYMNIPMIPWLSARVYFTYSGENSNWFRLEI